MPATRRQRVVILGAGFGGLNAAKRLSRADVDLTIVDRHSYRLFQPLLYQSRPRRCRQPTIAAPIRSLLRGASGQPIELPRKFDLVTPSTEWNRHR
jgi:NADH dehydrogenase